MQSLTKGLEELRQELADIAKSTDLNTRKQALEEGADIVVERARSIAPQRTGLLKREGIDKGDNTGDKIDVGWTKDGFYGRFLEYGTSKMAAQPHIRPAYEQTQTKVIDTMLREMKLK